MTAGPVPRDLETRADVERLVRAFYSRALTDPIIGWIFTDVAQLDLEGHVPQITAFWETILLDAKTYEASAFLPHAALHERVGLRPGHFERWLALWYQTLDEHFAGPRSEMAKVAAYRLAGAFQGRLRAYPSPHDAPAPALAPEAPAGLVVTRHGGEDA